MKYQLIEDVGYYHPRNANWSYQIHILIDETGARLYRDTFGGVSRFREKAEKEGHEVNRLYLGKGSQNEYKWKDVKHFPDIENFEGTNY